MALNNCTINSASVEVAKNAQVSSTASQVLTITPNNGYRVKAADFTAQTPPTGIASITLADSVGSNYESNNTVTVTCDLTNTYNPGNSDVTLTIDVDGDAVLEKDIPKTLSGVFNVSVTNATTAATNQAYSATDTSGTTKDLFTRTVTAISGDYFETAPTCVVATGDVDNYVITATPNGTGTSHTSTAFDINGIIPLITDTADVINITANAVDIPAATNSINSYSINVSDAAYSLSKRQLIVYGDVNATFTLTITRSGDSHTYNFTTNDFTSSSTNSGTLTIASNGQHLQLITLPVVTSDVTYTFTLAAVSPSSLSLTQSNNFTIARKGFKSVTVNATSSDRGTFQSKVITYTNYAGSSINQSGGSNSTYGQSGQENESENSAEFNFNIVVDDDQAFVFSSDSTLSSFTLNSGHYSITPSSGKAELAEGSIVATKSNDSSGNAGQLLTLVGTDWYNYKNGTDNTVITVNIDDFCSPGSGSGGNILTINSTVFEDITGGLSAVLYPSGYIQGVSGRTSGSTTVTYTLAGVQIAAPALPSYVDNIGDLTITATTVTSTSTNKFDSANFATNITSHNVSNAGTGSAVVTFDLTVTITSFSPAITSGDELGLKVMVAFNDVSQ